MGERGRSPQTYPAMTMTPVFAPTRMSGDESRSASFWIRGGVLLLEPQGGERRVSHGAGRDNPCGRKRQGTYKYWVSGTERVAMMGGLSAPAS